MNYYISDEVFAAFPDYVRGVVIAIDVHNGASPPELLAILRAEERRLRARLTVEELLELPHTQAWRAAYRALGCNPNKFRASVEAMARRVLADKELPSINALVDIGNIIALKHLVSTGSHAIDEVKGDLVLRPAAGSEKFVAFGSDALEHPDPGEMVFVEDNIVLTRRWTWRQANHTLTLPSTRSLVFNVDGLPPVLPAQVAEICTELMELVTRYCAGNCHYELLTQGQASIALPGS